MLIDLSPVTVKMNMQVGSLKGGLKSGANMAKKGYDKWT